MSEFFLSSLFGMEGQVAVVIGGTGVLCGAMAEGLALAGANVIVAGRDAVKGADRVLEIEEQGGKASFVPVDVMDRGSIEGLLRHAIETHGRVDMLINGAGSTARVRISKPRMRTGTASSTAT